MVGAIMYAAVQSIFEPLTKAYPALPPAPNALRKRFQSIEKDGMNMGWCVHLAADAAHLHVRPAWLPRACGAQPASVPWEAIRVEKQGRFSARVRIGAIQGTFAVPRWVARLAAPSPAPAGDETHRA